MKKNAVSLSAASPGKLTVAKKTGAAEQFRSAYLQAILSGSRLISGTASAPPAENPDRAAAIRYIKESGRQHRNY